MLVTCDGVKLDLTRVCPRSVLYLARQSTEDWLLDRAQQSSEYMSGLAYRPYLFPLRRLCNGARCTDLTPQYQASLRAIASNGIWDRARKYRRGLTTDPSCPLCGDCPGTLASWVSGKCVATWAYARD